MKWQKYGNVIGSNALEHNFQQLNDLLKPTMQGWNTKRSQNSTNLSQKDIFGKKIVYEDAEGPQADPQGNGSVSDRTLTVNRNKVRYHTHMKSTQLLSLPNDDDLFRSSFLDINIKLPT